MIGILERRERDLEQIKDWQIIQTNSKLRKELGRILDTEDDWSQLETLFFIAHILKARQVLELGTGWGDSGIAILYGMNKHGNLYSLDIQNYSQLRERINLLGLGDNFHFYQVSSLSPPEELLKMKYDFIYIDSNHEYEHVVKELELYCDLTKYIVMHDVIHEAETTQPAKAAFHFLTLHPEWNLIRLNTRHGLWLLYRL